MARSPFHMDLKFKCAIPFQHDIGWYNEGDWFPKDVHGFYDVGAKRRIPERLFRQLHDQGRIVSVEPETPGWDSISTPDGEGGELDPDALAAIAEHTEEEALVQGEPMIGAPDVVLPPADGSPAEVGTSDVGSAQKAVSYTHKGFGKYSTLAVDGSEIASNLTKAQAEALGLPKV